MTEVNSRMHVLRLLAALLLAACTAGDPGSPAPDAAGPLDVPSVGASDAPGPDTGADAGAPLDAAPDATGPDSDSDSASDADSDSDSSDPWALPPCYRACDRVVECGVEACPGHDWATAGLLFEECFQSCDDPWAIAAIGAAGCDAVLAAASAQAPEFAPLCETNPCLLACEIVADCVVGQCPGVASDAAPSLKAGCLETCTPEDVAWIGSSGSCEALVSAIAGADPGFAAACDPPVSTCANHEACVSYGDKLAACLVVQCDGHADAYEPGLAALLTTYCEEGAECPAEATVQAALALEVGCDSPALASLGANPPFATLCAGDLGATPEETAAACKNLLPCPGAEWLGTIETCMAYLAIGDDIAHRIGCLAGASGCSEVYACLEGL